MKKPGQWWDKSWTLVDGCTWLDGTTPAGCANCWAQAMARRFNAHALGDVKVRRSGLAVPINRHKPTVYACQINYGDLFHRDVPDAFIGAALAIVRATPRHRYVFLTKRYRRAAGIMTQQSAVVLMASVWDQDSTDAACEAFRDLPIRWGLHMEPLIAPVELPARPSWVVVGAENGPGARPFELEWACSIQSQCAEIGTPYWLKGVGKQSAPESMIVRELPW